MTKKEYLENRGYKQFQDSSVFIKHYDSYQGGIMLERERWFIDIDEDMLDIDEIILENLNEFAKILAKDFKECMKCD